MSVMHENKKEFALVMIFALIPLPIALVEIGRAYFEHLAVARAADAGARWATLSGPEQAAGCYPDVLHVVEASLNNVPVKIIAVTTAIPVSSPGPAVKVDVTYEHMLLFGLGGPTGINLTSSAIVQGAAATPVASPQCTPGEAMFASSPRPTSTSMPAASYTPANTSTPIRTSTATVTYTPTPTNTSTNTKTSTSTPTIVPTNTARPTRVNTPTKAPTMTLTRTPTRLSTFTPTMSPTCVTLNVSATHNTGSTRFVQARANGTTGLTVRALVNNSELLTLQELSPGVYSQCGTATYSGNVNVTFSVVGSGGVVCWYPSNSFNTSDGRVTSCP